MGLQNCHILLSVNKFTGHGIAYNPRNILIEFFEPNLTAYVQPLDAGIIRCFKALYHKAFCIHALDLNDAGEANIYKIDLLEAMTIAKVAWKDVTKETIVNCWNHTQIQL